MRAFLPDLVFVRLMRRSVVTELVEQPAAALGWQLPDELPGGVAFQVPQHTGEIGRGSP